MEESAPMGNCRNRNNVKNKLEKKKKVRTKELGNIEEGLEEEENDM
jgi:hypothetical protein